MQQKIRLLQVLKEFIDSGIVFGSTSSIFAAAQRLSTEYRDHAASSNEALESLWDDLDEAVQCYLEVAKDVTNPIEEDKSDSDIQNHQNEELQRELEETKQKLSDAMAENKKMSDNMYLLMQQLSEPPEADSTQQEAAVGDLIKDFTSLDPQFSDPSFFKIEKNVITYIKPERKTQVCLVGPPLTQVYLFLLFFFHRYPLLQGVYVMFAHQFFIPLSRTS